MYVGVGITNATVFDLVVEKIEKDKRPFVVVSLSYPIKNSGLTHAMFVSEEAAVLFGKPEEVISDFGIFDPDFHVPPSLEYHPPDPIKRLMLEFRHPVFGYHLYLIKYDQDTPADFTGNLMDRLVQARTKR